MQLSQRAHRSLSFLEEAMIRHGSAGQPLWPLAPSFLYDASVHGWGAILRTSAAAPGTEVVGGFAAPGT